MAAEKIIAGTAKTILVGGCETFSDVPIHYRFVLYCVWNMCNSLRLTTTNYFTVVGCHTFFFFEKTNMFYYSLSFSTIMETTIILCV